MDNDWDKEERISHGVHTDKLYQKSNILNPMKQVTTTICVFAAWETGDNMSPPVVIRDT